MKGFDKNWCFLLSFPNVSVGDLLLLKKENARFPNPAGRPTLGNDIVIKKGGILKLVQDLPLGLLAVALP